MDVGGGEVPHLWWRSLPCAPFAAAAGGWLGSAIGSTGAAIRDYGAAIGDEGAAIRD